MRALSIRQPWAWLILNAGKDIENRTWPTSYRGRILVHAGKTCTRREYDAAVDDAFYNDVDVDLMPELACIERGGIVGSVEIVGCVKASASPWFSGDYGFVLRDPRPMPFLAWKGTLGYFDVPDALIQDVEMHKRIDTIADQHAASESAIAVPLSSITSGTSRGPAPREPFQ